MKRLGIKYQLRIITLIPVLLVALIFALFYNYQYDKDLKQHMSRLGDAYINQLLPLAQLAIVNQHDLALQTLIDASAINPEIKTLAVYDTHGGLLAYRGGKPARNHPFTPPRFIGDSTQSTPISPYSIQFIAPITTPKSKIYDTARIRPAALTSADDVLGWLSITMDSKFMLIKRYQMYIATIFITLLALLLGLSVHYLLSKRIYRPIARLRRSMKQILSNEFETHIKTSSTGELGIIEQGCAHLQKQYLHSIDDINQHIELATMDLQQSLELLEEKNIDLSLEKKKTEEKSRQKSEFIANMSHEIRTPMNGVIGFTNVLLESKLDTLQLDYVKTIKASAQDLLTIINDILDYSKMDAGKLHLDCVPLNIRACIDEVLALIAPNANTKGIDLIPATAIDVPKTVLGDPWRLKQIISNLVSNAVKFTEYGYVLIRTNIEEETASHYTLCLSVTDTGIGISSSDQTTLFNAFNQAESTIAGRHSGSGLGLVICKKLVEHMHGRIAISSEIHKGSTFSVYIKLEKLASYEVEKNQTNRFAHLKVLCFDDNPLHLEALCNGLGYWGIHCIRVHAFNQLEDAFSAYPGCDMAFINVNQGCEHQVAQVLHKQSIPCLLVSKWFIHDLQQLGAEGLLFKPPNIQKLHDAIESVLQRTKGKPSAIHHAPKWDVPPQGALNQDALTNTYQDDLRALRTQLQAINPNILIAEDNRVNRMLLNSLLGEYACVQTVNDGEQTVAACNQQRFTIILLDLQMPKLNGLDAARLIRNESIYNKNTPIILISANSSDIPKDSLQKAGISFCLEKPIDEKSLLQHLLQRIDDTNTLAINWSLCVQKVSGNEALAVEFLARFVEELQLNRLDFLTLFNKNDKEGLERLAHKLHGACCFCGVAVLQRHVTNMEHLARHVHHVTELQDAFKQLIESIDAVLHDYAIHFAQK